MSARQSLLAAFGISLADLEANRAGKLGPAQAKRLLGSGRSDIYAALIIGILLAAILAFLADKPLKPVQFIVSGLLFAAALATGIHYYRRTRSAVDRGVVECLVGPVDVQSQQITVNGNSFRMPVRPWHVKSGQLYAVYFVPGARVIVAMEPEGWD